MKKDPMGPSSQWLVNGPSRLRLPTFSGVEVCSNGGREQWRRKREAEGATCPSPPPAGRGWGKHVFFQSKKITLKVVLSARTNRLPVARNLDHFIFTKVTEFEHLVLKLAKTLQTILH